MEAPIELKYFLDDPHSEESKKECKRVADIFSRMGALTVRDPRVTEDDNTHFLDMMERYYGQPLEQKMKDAREEFAYQVGVTPEGIEMPRCSMDPSCKARLEKMSPENRGHYPTEPDVKWRYFHRLGERPKETKFPSLNAEDVYPKNFPDWKEKMDKWGNKLLAAGHTLADMAAIGFGLPHNTFTNMMTHAPHLLAPTGSDLSKYGKKDQILAGFHQDINFITMHGKSRFSGLDIWLRNGQKIPVSIPNGCLLAQAGMQFEYLTAGAVVAGFHEVVVNDKTLEGIENAKKENRSLWRISSTLFIHIASDEILRPLLPCDNQEKFPQIYAGNQVANELKVISLDAKKYL